MNLLFPASLRRLDRHWLLNHPILWIMRFHWMVYWWFLAFILPCLIALVWPISLQIAVSLGFYFLIAFSLAITPLVLWVVLSQTSFAPQLGISLRPRTATQFLAGYLTIFSIYLACPLAFVGILRARSLDSFGESKIRAYESHPALHNTSNPILFEIFFKLYPESAKLLFSRTYIDHYDWRELVFFASLPLLFAVLLQTYQTTNKESPALVVTTLAFFVIIFMLFISSAHGKPTPLFFGFVSSLLLLFANGWYAVFLAPKPKKAPFLFRVRVNLFNLLLPWMPLFLRLSIRRAGYMFAWEQPRSGGLVEIATLLLGVALLFGLTPWIHRRYTAFLAIPS
jgi:hypothetical protein